MGCQRLIREPNGGIGADAPGCHDLGCRPEKVWGTVWSSRFSVDILVGNLYHNPEKEGKS